MVTRRRHCARSLTVATAILACGLAPAAYSAAETEPTDDPSGTVSVDGREYEPEPTAPPPPEDAPEPTAPPPPEGEDAPDPTAAPAPGSPPAADAPADAPAADAVADPPPPGQEPPADQPLAVAGAPGPHTEGTASAPHPQGGPGPAGRSSVSARASRPPGSMTPLRSSQDYGDAVPAPLVAPPEVAAAEGDPRRRAPRSSQAPAGLPELLGSVAPPAGLPRPGAAPGGLAVDRGAPGSLLATALAVLALAGVGYGGRAATRRRRAPRSSS